MDSARVVFIFISGCLDIETSRRDEVGGAKNKIGSFDIHIKKLICLPSSEKSLY